MRKRLMKWLKKIIGSDAKTEKHECEGAISSLEKDQYWGLVEVCLVRFFKYNTATAKEAALELRGQIGEAPEDDIFYHSEPFEIACDIAEQPSFDWESIWPEYMELLNKSGW